MTNSRPLSQLPTKILTSKVVGETKARGVEASNLILNLFLSAVAALILTEVVGYSRNVLLLHPEWISSKGSLRILRWGATKLVFRETFCIEIG